MTCRCTCKGNHLHGSSRSLVRRIGGSLPLNTGTRLYVQLPHMSDSPVRSPGKAVTVEGLDSNAKGLTLASYLKDPSQLLPETVGLLSMDEENLDVFESSEGMEKEGGKPTQETYEKISTLESELARLKAQIAVYALSETEGMEDVPAAPPPPTAPPVPPPPPIASTATPTPHHPEVLATPRPEPAGAAATPRPHMSSVLQDIGSVKLRTVDVAKSPGGTPFRRLQESKEPASNDPAAIIAHALRKKFAHKVFQSSPDKENLDSSGASFSAGLDSPSVKLFDQ